MNQAESKTQEIAFLASKLGLVVQFVGPESTYVRDNPVQIWGKGCIYISMGRKVSDYQRNLEMVKTQLQEMLAQEIIEE